MPAGSHTRDLRGRQTRIGRLARFYPEGFIHVLLYRIMVPLTILWGLFIIVSLLVHGLGTALKVVTAVVWILWTPQLFEVVKGLALAWSRGMAYGHLNPEFAQLYRKRYRKKPGIFLTLPWLFLVGWAAGFVLLIGWWHP